jgi:hypothetical protein
MFDSGVLGVVIGLILVYFLLSLLCSGVNELVEAVLRRRAKFLEAGILDLLGPALKGQLYDHPVVEALSPQKGSPERDKRLRDVKRTKPSYIPGRSFSQALAAILTDPSTKLAEAVTQGSPRLPVESTFGFRVGTHVQVGTERMRVTGVEGTALIVERARNNTQASEHMAASIVTRARDDIPDASTILNELQTTINQLPSGRLREALSGYLTAGGVTLDRWREQVEGWFDEKMDRVSGWYGRRTRLWLLLYGVVIAVVLNADTALFARTLWRDATVREAVVAQAEVVTQADGSEDPCEDPTCVANRLRDVKALHLPLGWPDLRVGDWGSNPAYVDDDRVPHSGADWWLKLFGLALTAAALTMGAPFWFDLLNKFTNFRAAGPPPERSTDAAASRTSP